MSLKVGVRVEIIGKDCQGQVAWIGHPAFAAGKWIGVILDEPKGKNNGTIKGTSYFQCADNHGMFVRQTQLIVLNGAGNKHDSTSPSTAGSNVTTPDDGAARARSRLNSSRLSLAGSKTQLSGQSTENLTGSIHERKDAGESGIPVSTSLKRASFVEKSPSTSSPTGKRPKAQDDRNNTGFVETLKPNFVPGQVMAGSLSSSTTMTLSSNIEEKLNNHQLTQENDNLKAQVNDLNEKVDILRMKRVQDKERLKDFEKTKIQFDQLLEFKSKVMESQASLQRELQRARQEAREAQHAKTVYQEEMADLSETVEMATLDKEMAEEKAETLQIELEQLKEKLEEKTLDLEILRTEMSERASGTISSGSAPSSFEVKQLEQQNIRLRETLVKMRDLSAHEKHEFQKLQKDLDQKKSEILELGRTKEKLSARVEEMEHQIADLQEQVDAALGAEEMVEMLGEKKMVLEERVAQLEEAVSDLEQLQDMSDQLAESSKELELELREELDMALAAARDSQRHRDAALETLADREMTITKFRELTQQLQEQCLQLQNRVQSTESSQTGGADQQLAEILDFQKTFAESRAQTKAVDLELRRLDAEEATSHVKLLLSFMPPAFLARGSDHDSIMTLLLIPRMLQKTEIIISQVRDKYRAIDKVDKAGVLKGHSVAQYAFRSRLCGHMHALQTILGCFESSLNTCSSDILLKVGAAYPEMAAQEKSLDFFIQLAKKDQLDENVPIDSIEKCCTYFSTMFSVLFGDSAVANQAKMVINGTRTLGNLCNAIVTEATAVKILLEGEGGDIGLLCQHIETTGEVIQNNLNSARRRVPRENLTAGLSGLNLGLGKDWPEQFSNCYQHAVKITKTLQDLVKSALQIIVSNGDLDTGLNCSKLKEMAAISTEKIYDADDVGPVATLKSSLIVLQQMAANLAQKMAECENELAITGTTGQQNDSSNEATPPIQLRAQVVRKEAEETKVLARRLESRDADIREAKIALREKQEELSEMALRKELAEKKLATLQHDHELNMEKMKRKLEEAQNQLKRKEKEFEETMDHLQTDIDSLESEKGQLKEKLKSIGKKAITPISGQVAGMPESTMNVSSDGALSGHMASVSQNNKLLVQEIAALKEALNNENRIKRKLLSESLKCKFDALEPLPVIPCPRIDSKINELQQKRMELLKDVQNAMVYPVVPDLTKTKVDKELAVLAKTTPAYDLIKRQMAIKTLMERAQGLANDVREATVKKTIGGRAPANFAIFPNREMAAAMKEKDPLIAAKLYIPFDGTFAAHNVNVGTEELRKVHSLLCY